MAGIETSGCVLDGEQVWCQKKHLSSLLTASGSPAAQQRPRTRRRLCSCLHDGSSLTLLKPQFQTAQVDPFGLRRIIHKGSSCCHIRHQRALIELTASWNHQMLLWKLLARLAAVPYGQQYLTPRSRIGNACFVSFCEPAFVVTASNIPCLISTR